MSHRSFFCVISACFAACALVNSAPAIAGEYYNGSDPDPYFHSGATDPTEQGWLIDQNVIDLKEATQSIASDPQYSDISAWQISADRRLNYYREDTPEPGDPWTLITRFRVVDNNESLSFNVQAGVDYPYGGGSDAPDSQRYIFRAGTDSNGKTLLEFPSSGASVSHTVAAGPDGNTDYVTVALVHAGGANNRTMDVFVNEEKIASDVPAVTESLSNRVTFGDRQTSGALVTSRWTEVLFNIGPQACRDGIDNDGDGFTDFVDSGDGTPAANSDPDCSDPNDPTEGNNNHTVVSWGDDNNQQVGGTTGGTAILEVASGGAHSVALKANGQLVAWGDNSDGQAMPPPGTEFIAVAAGDSHSLALKDDGSVTGWGDNGFGQAAPPNEQFQSISAGTNHSLGLRDDGTVIQWGLSNDGQWQPPAGLFQSIDAGHDYSLGVRTDGSIACWGDDAMCIDNPSPAGSNYVSVAAGHTHALALRQDGSLVGWGSNTDGEIDLPLGHNYIAIAASEVYSLALTNDGTLAHRGRDALAERPSGDDFVAISAGTNHASALRGVPQFDTPLGVCSDAVSTPNASREYDVSDRESFNAAIACYNAVAGGDITINFIADVLLVGSDPGFPVNNSSSARLFVVGNSANVELENEHRFLTIEAGEVDVRDITVFADLSNNSSNNGAAIYNAGTLVLRESTFHSHETGPAGGAIFNDLGAELTVFDSTFSGNEATEGGAIFNKATVTLANSVLSSNFSGASGGALVNDSGAELTVLNSTFIDNDAGEGGAIVNSGTLFLVNSTLTENTSDQSGSVLLNASGASATLYNSTLYRNPALSGAVINNTGDLTLKNTIVDNAQTQGDSCADFSTGLLNADSHNLVTDSSCGNATQTTSNLIGLGPLRDNGGPTQTHALLPGSVAINAADLATCNGDPVNGLDQRGLSRAANSTCDIGAFESQGPIIEIEQTITAAENQPIAIDLDAELDGSNSADEGMSYVFSTVNGGGADNALFSLDPNTGIVTFNVLPDFERPGGVATDNTYSVQVSASDQYGNSQVANVLITVTDDVADNCSPAEHSRMISDIDTWHLLTLPCDLPTDATLADLFGDQVLLDNEWSAWRYDELAGGYEQLTATDPAPDAGSGFWFISTEPVLLSAPDGSQKAKGIDSDNCIDNPCYRQSIDYQTNWNLLGNPATEKLRYSEMQVSNESTNCTEIMPCNIANPVDSKISSAMFVYNSFAGAYRSVDSSLQQVLKPWDGYWAIFSYDGELAQPWHLFSTEYLSQFVFVTDESFTGNLGGLSGGDDICQQAADNAGLSGSFKAWMSAGDTSPSNSFTQNETPYILLDGRVVADSYSDLTSSPPEFPINITEKLGGEIDDTVWSDTWRTGGAVFGQSCNNWTSTATVYPGAFGITTNHPEYWTHRNFTADCTELKRLYCFEQ